ncbi:FAD:protein FMN transferase [Ichthyobacterium seriolicida]|nr:FAD:protein FMN transferase [Ichthyobacterium seriolicida]
MVKYIVCNFNKLSISFSLGRVLSLLVISFILSACEENIDIMHLYEGDVFGTTYSIKYTAREDQDYKTDIDSLFKVINKSMSTYSADSDISKINDGKVVYIDEMFEEVFFKSKEIYNKTEGYFDPTVYVLEKMGNADSEKDLQELRNLVGFGKLKLIDGYIYKDDPDVIFTFNAIAKGYAIDLVGRLLDKKGSQNYLIEIGGEILVKGKKIDGKKWMVGIESPRMDLDRQIAEYLVMEDQAVATSGNYRKYTIDKQTNKKRVHIINPISGEDQESDIISASVVSKSCMIADAYATAFMAMGFDKSISHLKESREDISVYFIYIDSEGNEKTYISENLKKQIIRFL